MTACVLLIDRSLLSRSLTNTYVKALFSTFFFLLLSILIIFFLLFPLINCPPSLSRHQGIYQAECQPFSHHPNLKNFSQAKNLFLHILKRKTDMISTCNDINEVISLCLKNLFRTAKFILSQ